MQDRTCRYCNLSYPIDNFEIAKKIGDKVYRRWKCRKCYVARKSERRREIKKKVDEYKKTLSCVKCGISDFRVMDFHHKNDDKEFSVSNGIEYGFSFDRIMKEVHKCDPVCANCHRILHYEKKETECRLVR